MKIRPYLFLTLTALAYYFVPMSIWGPGDGIYLGIPGMCWTTVVGTLTCTYVTG